MIMFNVEEENLLAIYYREGTDRETLIETVRRVMPYMSPGICRVAKSAVAKLKRIPGAEFSRLGFYAAEEI